MERLCPFSPPFLPLQTAPATDPPYAQAIAALVDLNGDRENALHAAGRRVRAKAQRLLSVPDAVPESDLIDSMRSKIEREK